MADETEIGPGTKLGDYVLESRIGSGSFGTVWLAHHGEYSLQVAVKTLTSALAARSTPTLRAEVELLAATASSRSAHVVRVLDGGTDPVPYIVMEYIEGRDLASMLRTKKVLPIPEVIRVGIGVADALSALEVVGIIHRDVKPANVMIDVQGTVKLTDFGIAKIVGFETMTTTGQVPLTMAYAAPEVWESEASNKSDLYSFGILLYECLVGSPPFRGGFAALYRQHTSAQPDLTVIPPETPPALVRLIASCLTKTEGERPADAGQCIKELETAAVELHEAQERKRQEERSRLRPPARLGPWVLGEPLADRAMTWHAVHNETCEAAIVEAHIANDLSYGNMLRRAVAANATLISLGAERLIGSNRFLLRPGEGWRDAPAGELYFWLAREGIDQTSAKDLLMREAVEEIALDLSELLNEAKVQGLDIGLSAQRLAIKEDKRIRYRRPGLPLDASEKAAVDGLALLRELPLTDDARQWLGDFETLEELVESIPEYDEDEPVEAEEEEPEIELGVARVADPSFLGSALEQESDIETIVGVYEEPEEDLSEEVPETAQERNPVPISTESVEPAQASVAQEHDSPASPAVEIVVAAIGLFVGLGAAMALAFLLLTSGNDGKATAPISSPGAAPVVKTELSDQFSASDSEILQGDGQRSNGQYTMQTTSAPSAIAYVGQTLTDSSTKVDVSASPESQDVTVGLACRWQGIQTQAMYRLELHPRTQTFSIVRWDSGGEYSQLATFESEVIQQSGQNSLELRCIGNEIVAIINGYQTASVRDDRYKSGRSYLWLGASNASASFDNLVVEEY